MALPLGRCGHPGSAVVGDAGGTWEVPGGFNGSNKNWGVRREAVVLGEFETQSSWESVDT